MDYLISDILSYAMSTLAEASDYKAATILSVFLAALALVLPGRKASERIIIAALVAYLTLTFASTVLLRGETSYSGVVLTPFYSWRLALGGDGHTFLLIVENIALFVPIGLALGYVSSKSGVLSFIIVIAFAMAFSCSIELMQYVNGVGLTEFDDVFDNTLGATIGCFIAYLICFIGSCIADDVHDRVDKRDIATISHHE